MPPYTLITPVTIEKRTPGRDGAPDRVETRAVASFARRAITGAVYFKHGDVSFLAQSPSGTSYEVEIDEAIEAYLRHSIDDPDAALIFDALTLPDALALREDLVESFGDAAARARSARGDADPELVTLLDPFMVHGETTREIRLDEPTHRAFARHGRPFTWSRMADGAFQPVERMSVIRAYLDKSAQHDLGADMLGLVSLTDAMQLKRAVLGFFTRAAAAASGARRSTPSSSTADTSPSTPPTP